MKDSVQGSAAVQSRQGNPVNFGGLPCFRARGEDLWPAPSGLASWDRPGLLWVTHLGLGGLRPSL